MKKPVKNLSKLICLASLTFLFGCDPCANVECHNGGKCVDGDCECPDGYGGPECEEKEPPSVMQVTSITITKFPQYDNGSNWDVTDGPDLFVMILQGSTVLHEQPYMFEDASSGFSYAYVPDIPITLSDPESKYSIALYDFDNVVDDYMGGITFTPYNADEDFPAIKQLDAGAGIEFELAVEYAW